MPGLQRLPGFQKTSGSSGLRAAGATGRSDAAASTDHIGAATVTNGSGAAAATDRIGNIGVAAATNSIGAAGAIGGSGAIGSIDVIEAQHSDPGAGVLDDSHRGYMNFGLWEGATDYASAAERLVERLGLALELAPGARVIDAACGRGSQDLYLLRRFGALSIDALDVTRNNIELALAQAASCAGPGELRFHHASATRLPFPDASFSHAICVEAAHHFDTREAYLREAHRVLVPGGRIALADITMRRLPRTRTERALVDAATALWGIPRANVVTVEGYRAMFARIGFRITAIEEVSARTFPGYYEAQRTAARRRELIASRGRIGAMVGAVMNFAAHRVYRAGLLDYLLVSAVKPNSEHGGGDDGG